MTPDPQPEVSPARVSILARIVPAFSYGLPALGAAVSAYLVIQVFKGMRNAESSGMAAIAGGISEANTAIVVTLYLAILIGLAGVIVGIVRMLTATKTASPSAWFFLITGLLGFCPTIALWLAQSIVLDVIFGFSQHEGGVSAIASQISLLLMIAIITAPISLVILLVSSVVPLPGILRAKRKWAPLVALLTMQIIIVAMTVMYHLRTSWLWEQVQKY